VAADRPVLGLLAGTIFVLGWIANSTRHAAHPRRHRDEPGGASLAVGEPGPQLAP